MSQYLIVIIKVKDYKILCMQNGVKELHTLSEEGELGKGIEYKKFLKKQLKTHMEREAKLKWLSLVFVFRFSCYHYPT